MERYIEEWVSYISTNKHIVVIISILAVIVVVSFLKKYLTRFITDGQSRYYVRKFITFAGYIIGLLLLFSAFSKQMRNITVIIGIAGAGIAFALQEVIASIAGWLAVTFSSFYKVGDRVQLGGITGDVIDIGMLRTTVMECGEWIKSDLYTGRIVRIANSFVFKEPLFNYSGDFPFLWDEIQIPIKYGSDHNMAREIINRVANEVDVQQVSSANEWWRKMVNKYAIKDARTEPAVTLVLNDNWMEFTVRYVVDYKKRRVTKDMIFSRILDEFAKTDGKVAIASTTINIVQTPPIDVRISKKD